jgi:hypothetical protein
MTANKQKFFAINPLRAGVCLRVVVCAHNERTFCARNLRAFCTQIRNTLHACGCLRMRARETDNNFCDIWYFDLCNPEKSSTFAAENG